MPDDTPGDGDLNPAGVNPEGASDGEPQTPPPGDTGDAAGPGEPPAPAADVPSPAPQPVESTSAADEAPPAPQPAAPVESTPPVTEAAPAPAPAATVEPAPTASTDAPTTRPDATPQPEPAAPPPAGVQFTQDGSSVPPPLLGQPVESTAPVSFVPAPEPAAPAKPRSTGKIVAVLAALAVLGGIGAAVYFVFIPYSIRRDAQSHLDDAARSCVEGDFAAALEHAQAAEKLVIENEAVFTEQMRSRAHAEVGEIRRAGSIHDEGQAHVDAASEDFVGSMQALEGLIAAERDVAAASPNEPVGDVLVHDLQRMLDTMLWTEAKRVAESDLDAADGLERLDVVLAALPGREHTEDAKRTFTLADAFAKAAVEAEVALNRTAFSSATDKAAAKSYDDAMETLRERARAFKDLPPQLRTAVEADFFRTMRDLSDGRALEGLPEPRESVKAFFALSHVMVDASAALETALSDDGAREKLEKLKTRADELAKELAWSDSKAPARLDGYLAEVDGLDVTYDSYRRLISGGDSGAFAAISCIDAARGSRSIRLRPRRVKSGAAGVTSRLRVRDAAAEFEAPRESFDQAMFVTVRGYRFRFPWTHDRLCPYLLVAAQLAEGMEATHVARSLAREWRVIEGPGVPLAVDTGGEIARAYVPPPPPAPAGAPGVLCEVEREAAWQDPAALVDAVDPAVERFIESAKALVEAIKGDEEIELDIRQAMAPVIESSYGKTDPRDLLEPEFCRRIVDEGYLEGEVADIAVRHADALAAYRAAVEALGAERPIFTLQTSPQVTHTAMRSIDTFLSGEDAFEDGSLSVDIWRTVDRERNVTRYARPLKQSMFYWLQVATEHQGIPGSTAPGDASRRAVVHMVTGEIASFAGKEQGLVADEDAWRTALAMEIEPGRRESLGEAGWEFPPHVPVFDASGRTVGIALRAGFMESPVFDAVEDDAVRVARQDAFLDECAEKMASPGELGLFFRYMMQYCHDSPVQSMPKLVGNHVAQGEMHQTVHEFLDRKLGGMFTGDCDDISEFFQVVTRRQGKLSHVFSLPKHAACGYVDKVKKPSGDDAYELVFLQTGPPVIFEGDTLDATIEKGILHFSEDEAPHFTVASVPFLFRFAGEKTRTQYWLSDRICVDEEYADLLILVQSYWHYHYYATAIRTMEERLETDKDISNYIELSGLYRRVRLFRKAIAMQHEALQVHSRDDEKVRLNEIVDLASYHHRLKQDETAKLILTEIASVANAMKKTGSYEQLYRLLPVRLEAAALYCAMKEPMAAYSLVDTDIRFFIAARGDLIEPLRDVALTICMTLRKMMDEGTALDSRQQAARDRLLDILRDQFDTKVFKDDDSFNGQIRNYTDLALLVAAIDGKKAVRAKLLADGPYPDGPRTSPRTGRDVTDDDWSWIRICSPVYAGYIVQLTNSAGDDEEGWWEDEGTFEPETALALADAMARGVAAGRRIGSMTMFEDGILKVDLLRAMLEKDIEAFGAVLARAVEMANDRHMQRLAIELGRSAGLIPPEEFGAWMDVFREHIQGKQHFFHIAHVALANKHIDHAFIAADKSVTYFPGEKMMAAEATYMRSLADELAAKQAEIDRQEAIRKEWKPLYNKTLSMARGGKFAESVEIGKKALALADTLGDEHPESVLTLQLLAEIEAIALMHDDAKAHLERAIDLWSKQGYLSYESTAAFVMRMANSFAKAGRGDVAVRLYQLAVTSAEKARGAESADTAKAMYALADFYTGVNETGKAIDLLRRVLAIDERAFGKEHAEVAFDLGKLAGALAAAGKLEEAEEQYRRSIAVTEPLRSADKRLPPLLVALAGIHKERGKLDDAVAQLTRARDMYTRSQGAESAEVLSVVVALADAHARKGDSAKTRELYERAIEMSRKSDQHDDDVKRGILEGYAVALWKLEEYAAAERQLLVVLALDREKLGDDHRQVGVVYFALSRLMKDAGNAEKAAGYRARAVAIVEKLEGKE